MATPTFPTLPTWVQLGANAAAVLCAQCVAVGLGSWASCPSFGTPYPLAPIVEVVAAMEEQAGEVDNEEEPFVEINVYSVPLTIQTRPIPRGKLTESVGTDDDVIEVSETGELQQ